MGVVLAPLAMQVGAVVVLVLPFDVKLWCEAHASISVPSTEK
jgi:hypothetical protein